MRILVVDDKFESRWKIAGWLSAFLRSAAVESAASADEALEMIRRRKPDLVLAAHPMPTLDGLGLARALKAQADAPVVVVMTEKSDAQFEAACMAARADLFLEKRHLQARLLDFVRQRFGITPPRGSLI